jgi:V8-like Glu-specific endopeptidase
MTTAYSSVSAEAMRGDEASAATASESIALLETSGHPGADAELSSQADLLVAGKREEALVRPTRRAGIETVIGTDERVRITETDKLPWRIIAALRLIPRPPLTAAFIGTGWFIGRRTLLTAGHCVFSESDFGGWIGRIEVSPGRNGNEFPFGTANAVRFSALAEWQARSDPDFDVGCIHLDEPLGDRVGYFKVAAKTDSELENELFNVSGYPLDRGRGTQQLFHANRVLHPAARRIYYDMDTYGGQSGSPVWLQDEATNEPVAVGIHAYGVGGTPASLNITANSAPRITPELLETIRGWLAEDG